jgi:hypothetical protein
MKRGRRRMGTIPRQLSLGDINEKFIRDMADLRICRDLVDIARGVLGRPELCLEFSKGDDAYTDGTSITVPRRHKKKRLLTKHELAHIYFLSDLSMRRAFAEVMVDRLFPLSKRRDRLIGALCYLVNVLDDVRVNSLWGEVWPGDGSRMRSYFRDEVGKDTKKILEEDLAKGNDISLTNYLILRATGQKLPCRWSYLDSEITDALKDIRIQTFKALLVRSKSLLEKMILAEAKEIKESDAFPVIALKVPDLGTAPPGPSLVSEEVKELIEDLLNQDEEEEESFFDEEQDSMFDRLEDISDALEDLQPAEKQPRLKYRMKSVVLPPSSLLQPEWTAEMRIEADRWSSLFRSIVGTKTDCLDVEGGMIDHQEFLRSRLTRTFSPYYKNQVTGLGFHALVLVDMSGSMAGVFGAVNRLYLVLSKALSLPFVKLKVIGFTSDSFHRLLLYDFGDSPSSLHRKNECWGLTPTNLALEHMPAYLPDASAERHLFLLTDGWPYEDGQRDDVVAAEVAYNRRAVQDLGINVHTFLIGDHAFSDQKRADKLFGVNSWRNISEKGLYQESFSFLASLFVSYVNRSL